MGIDDGDDATTQSEREADRQAKAMNDGLRKDVKEWAAARHGSASRAADGVGVPPQAAVSAVPASRVRKPKTAPVVAPAQVRNKPFSMSYDGVTTAEHIATMLARGAR